MDIKAVLGAAKKYTDAEIIKKEPTITESLQKANQAIDSSVSAVNTANSAKQDAASTQTQLNTIVVESGTSDAETLQARVDKQGVVYSTLKERVDAEQGRIMAIDKNTSQNRSVYYDANTLSQKPMVTFVDDDGSIDVLTKLKPIFNAKGVPCVVAAVAGVYDPEGFPGQMTPQELLDLQNIDGWEIASHGYNHRSFIVIDDDKDAVRFEAIESKRKLESYGLEVDSMVYPSNAATTFARQVVSNQYDCAASGGDNINTRPVSSYGLRRVPMGSYFSDSGRNTYEYYKSRVDEAISKNGWCIFMMHCYSPDHDETQQQHMSDIIDYCLANNVDIVTLRDGLKTFGNKVEMPGKVALTNQGEFIFDTPIIDKTATKYPVLRDETIVHDSPITDFVQGSITITNITPSKQGSLPAVGYLHTFRGYNPDTEYSSQKLYRYNTNNIYYRRWSAGAWTPWIDLTPKGVTITVPSVEIGSVPAGGSKVVTIDVGRSTRNKPLVVTTNTPFTEVSYSYMPYSTSQVAITFRNSHTGALDVGSRDVIVHFPNEAQ